MKNIIVSNILLLLSFTLMAQIPPRPEPPRLVNDLAGILNDNEREELENILVAFNDSTSTQIAVVTVKDLGNYDPNQFAYEIGQTWGVGQKGKNNGLVVLVKPKLSETDRGKVSIQVAYGLEDVVTDALSNRIIDNEMIPRFRQNDYYGGIVAAVKVLMDVTKGKYTADQYSKKTAKKQDGGGGIILAIIIIVVILSIIGRNNKNNRHNMSRRGSDLPLWMLLGGLGGSHKSSGWGGFSSGSGGFGGFGGGSFGGGGASGSW